MKTTQRRLVPAVAHRDRAAAGGVQRIGRRRRRRRRRTGRYRGGKEQAKQFRTAHAR
jgi:hypothetical protein